MTANTTQDGFAAERRDDGADQKYGTAGIPPLERPSAVTRFFMGIVAKAERLNLKYARLGNPPVYDNRVFPWVGEIEKAAPQIRAELDRVLVRKS
jgi:hypothetical protein